MSFIKAIVKLILWIVAVVIWLLALLLLIGGELLIALGLLAVGAWVAPTGEKWKIKDKKIVSKSRKNTFIEELASKKVSNFPDKIADFESAHPTKNEDSIIDVSNPELTLSINYSDDDEEVSVPYWGHQYVYSHTELKNATAEQKAFYAFFKKKILDGEFVDIGDNSNYAFVLYFDLLNEYQNHQDIKILEKQFQLIGEICPKTKNYSLGSLIEKLRQRTDTYSVYLLENLEDPVYKVENGYSDYEPDYYKLGSRYKKQLGLSDTEVELLNQFTPFQNVFTADEECLMAVIKHFLSVMKNFERYLISEGRSFKDEFLIIQSRLRKRSSSRYRNYWEGGYDPSRQEIYLSLFRRVENSVRDRYLHKRKLSTHLPDSGRLKKEFEEMWGNDFNQLLLELTDEIKKPSVQTEIALNAQTPNRWKTDFEALKTSFNNGDKESFKKGVGRLEKTNAENLNIENIFFEAAKFLAAGDRVEALNYYAKYIFYNTKSDKFKKKNLLTSTQKLLFETKAQSTDFEDVITELEQSLDLENAITKLSVLYVPKRRKIVLNSSAVKEAETAHGETIKRLNQYLEEDDIQTSHKATSVEPQKVIQESDSPLISGLFLPKFEQELILKIEAEGFKMLQTEVDAFATERGLFKNQIIDSINETCAEFLEGEMLIEEEGEMYVIEKTYYQEILK
jgi:hypothetical protein